MTQKEFARELGTTPRTIGRHERGEHKLRLTLGQIKRLKELLEQAGMSIDDLPDDID
nr:helix-turn-helix transcriptional regulator [Allocoleopsis franciscana]